LKTLENSLEDWANTQRAGGRGVSTCFPLVFHQATCHMVVPALRGQSLDFLSSSVKPSLYYLGVPMIQGLSLDQHVNSLVRSCFYQRRNIEARRIPGGDGNDCP